MTANIPAAPVTIEGDEQALSRLRLILLDNAVKYTNPGGRIRFEIAAGDMFVEAKVADSGVGIAPEELPHIFDRFWRADKVRSRAMGGAGLGLSIAQWIVQKHQGSIEVHTEPGKGAEFVTRFPVAALAGNASV